MLPKYPGGARPLGEPFECGSLGELALPKNRWRARGASSRHPAADQFSANTSTFHGELPALRIGLALTTFLASETRPINQGTLNLYVRPAFHYSIAMTLFDLDDTTHLPPIPGLDAALKFLRTCPDNQPDGTVEIDGRNVFAIIQSYETKNEHDAPRFEAHRKYIDIQFLLSGRELMGWAPISALTVTEPYNSEKDILFGTVPDASNSFTSFTARQAIVLFPSDAHAPGLAQSAPQPVKKVVIKMLVC